MNSKEIYGSISPLLKEGKYKVLGSIWELYKYPGSQNHVKKMVSSFVQT
jgi:hypothetical protein